jgi:transposase InsO family protein
MTLKPDPDERDRWAHFRYSIIAPLLAAPPSPGELWTGLTLLAAKTWRRPDNGLDIQFSVATLERWYYRVRDAKDPVATLRTVVRCDRGRFPSMSVRAIELLTEQYADHSGWTAQLHYDNLRTQLGKDDIPSYPTIRRYMRAQGLFRKKQLRNATPGMLAAIVRVNQREIRSFEMEHAGALWHLDFHHGSRKILLPTGEWVKPYLLCVIDDHSRLVCHIQWFLDETAQSLAHGLCQAFQKRGLPRMLMTDNGAAMLAEEVTTGLGRLGVLHQTTLPYSPYQNAKQEAFWARIESRLMAMLEGETELTLEVLNRATQAWVEMDYHRARHSEINTSPLERFIEAPKVLRESPETDLLRQAFRIEVKRTQRRSDGTVSLDGRRFEIPARYRTLERVILRLARWDMGYVHLVCPLSGNLLCQVKPLDKAKNSSGERRQLELPTIEPAPAPCGIAPLLKQLMAEYAATGLPPAYVPLIQKESA